MRINMKPVSVIEANLGIQDKGPVHKFFTEECARQMDRFVPFDKGDLAKTVIVNGQPTENVHNDYIVYNQPYASYVYYGIRDGRLLNIKKDKHPDATSLWDMHMWTAKKADITQAVQNYIGGKK